ncbi:MAG: serine hydrolase domain-containing protein [Pirellulales bacterium]
MSRVGQVASQASPWERAEQVLEQAVARGQVHAAVLHVRRGSVEVTRAFGRGVSPESIFLLGSISKPVVVAAVMTLIEQGELQLDDQVARYLPGWVGEGREPLTVRHLLTHVSGLPDQLPENQTLRRQHAPLAEFVQRALSTPLSFAPGTAYQYSSLGILLVARIAEVISGIDMLTLVEQRVLRPLEMRHSAQGLGSFTLADVVPCQTEQAAPEAGGGDPTARDWDWNSLYWRQLGAPWGGTHASAPDVGRFLAEFLYEEGRVLQPATARLMIGNALPPGLPPRGLGWGIGVEAGSPGCSDRTFGHSGSTGTVCWADPASDTICVVLTSLPAQAALPHPRDLAAARVAAAVRD